MARPITSDAAAAAEAADRAAVRAALTAASGNVTAAAAALGCARRTLDRRINDLGLRDWLSESFPRSARQPRVKNRHEGSK